MLKVQTPDGSRRILLHSCCAPCSGAIIECLLANGITPVVFFSNSNIYPQEEYLLRKAELVRYCEQMGVEVVEDEYEHEEWLDFALKRSQGVCDKELAQMPERRERCTLCFRFRLLRAFRYASAHGLGIVATTLASSRWKDLAQVAQAAAWASEKAAEEGCSRVLFWDQNWRKGGLQPRRSEIICEQGFYNQNWCGCEFSRKSADD